MEKPKETFIQRIAPGITVFLLSSLGISMASNWADVIRVAEVVGRLVERVELLEEQARHGSRFAEKGKEIERKLEHLQEDLQNLRVQVAKTTRPNR